MADLDLDGSGYVGTHELVTVKFNATLDAAEEWRIALVGASGDGGYLGELNSIITEFPDAGDTIKYGSITVPDLSVDVDSRPAVDVSGLDTDFPTFDKVMGALQDLPTIDTSSLLPGAPPTDTSELLSWVESVYNQANITTLMDQLLSDLSSGAGGLGGVVEQEIYDRAVARQVTDNDRLYDEVNNLYSGSRWDLPSGAYVAGMKEVAGDIARNTRDINSQIIETQAELAQKNQQFVITAISDLEKVKISLSNSVNDRSLDYEKAVVANALAIYSEGIRAYVAIAEANKIYVEVQVEELKAAIEYNKGLVDVYSAEADAYKTQISAIASKNDALIGAIEADIKGYDSETRAIAANQDTQIKAWQLKLDNADNNLKALIAEVEANLKAYIAEYNLKESVANDMAKIAMQGFASSYGATNASAGVSSSGSNSTNHSYDETKEISEGIRESISTSYSNDMTKGIDAGETTSHNHLYQE